MGTVGLSMGITADLGGWGKGLLIVTMLVGRLRTLTFGLALLARDEEGIAGEQKAEHEAEREEERARQEEREEDEDEEKGEEEDQEPKEADEDELAI